MFFTATTDLNSLMVTYLMWQANCYQRAVSGHCTKILLLINNSKIAGKVDVGPVVFFTVW